MLPFSKRPKPDDDADEVLTKESLAGSNGSRPREGASGLPRPFAPSICDEEMTTLMPSKGMPLPSPRDGRDAGRNLPSVPPPARSSRSAAPPAVKLGGGPSARPSAAPSRSKRLTHDDDEKMTEVRTGPKVVKRASKAGGVATAPPTGRSAHPSSLAQPSAQPSAQTSGRGRTSMMPGPPAELLEDLVDRQGQLPLGRTGGGPAAQLQTLPRAMPVQQVQPHGLGQLGHMGAQAFVPRGSYPPPPPPPPSYPQAHPSYPPAPMSSSSLSHGRVPMSPASMPPHFMVPQAPFSDGRLDPPGTALTNRARAGRATSTWAMALLAFGLCVGVGGVAVTQTHADTLLETTASFVDPSRAGSPRAAAAPAPAASPAAVIEPVPVPVPVAEAPKVAVPAVAIAVPPAVVVPAVAPVAEPVAQPVAVAEPAPQKPVVVAVAAPAPKPVAVAVAAPTPAPKPVAVAAPTPRPVPKPVAVAAASEGEAAPRKPVKKGSSKGAEMDEETRKALETLQKSQLESSF